MFAFFNNASQHSNGNAGFNQLRDLSQRTSIPKEITFTYVAPDGAKADADQNSMGISISFKDPVVSGYFMVSKSVVWLQTQDGYRPLQGIAMIRFSPSTKKIIKIEFYTGR